MGKKETGKNTTPLAELGRTEKGLEPVPHRQSDSKRVENEGLLPFANSRNCDHVLVQLLTNPSILTS